jgi:GntR family transcriptional repressor for pyruvate dehydrogenase complex
MRQAVARGRNPVQHDRQFHVAIAALTANAVLQRLVGALYDERHGPIASALQSRSENAQSWAHALDEHAAIVQALESRDALLAQTAMRMHLGASQRRWLDSH